MVGRGCVGWVREVEEEEAGGGWGEEGGDVGRGELVDAFEIPTIVLELRRIETYSIAHIIFESEGIGMVVVGETHI